MEEDGGSTLVGALVAGDRKLRAVARSWGCCDVNSSYSRVFLANFQGCTVLFFNITPFRKKKFMYQIIRVQLPFQKKE